MWWRVAPFVAILVAMMIWESLAPRRERVSDRTKRTINNLLLTVLNSLMLKLLPLLSAVAAATWAERVEWGFFHLVDWPFYVEVGVTIVLFDLLIYWQHVASHHVPMLWQFHQLHHSDHDLDASSALRFHPVEIAFSMAIKSVGAILLGAAPIAVLLFEVILNGCAIFSHSNLNIPLGIDRLLRLLLVTPDMHRIHHSVEQDESGSNFGFNMPWWDRFFGTYRAQPRGDQRRLKLGLPDKSDQTAISLIELLTFPWKHSADGCGQPIDAAATADHQ